MIIKRISRAPIYYARWEDRALYNNTNDRHKHKHRQTDRQTDTQTHRHTDTQTEADRQPASQIDRDFLTSMHPPPPPYGHHDNDGRNGQATTLAPY